MRDGRTRGTRHVRLACRKGADVASAFLVTDYHLVSSSSLPPRLPTSLAMEYADASPAIDLMGHATAITPLPDANAASDELPDKISAYYSLVFPSFTYYVQTISVTIGRRSARPGTPSSSDQSQVDVDLGPLKSVSRSHAKIEYEENQERFVLVVIGRNGAWVDGIWSGSGSRVPLGAR